MKIQILVGAALALACGSALAGHGPGHEHGKEGHGMGCPMMGAAKASPEERVKMRGEMFAMMDADKDGSVSRAEFDKHHDAMWKQHMAPASQQAEGDKKPAE